MNALLAFTLGCLAVLGAACGGQDESEVASVPVSLGDTVVRDGIVYTPAGIGSKGCVLYNIRIPKGQAPAAMAYQSTEGVFSYGRPRQCVKTH